MGLALVVENSPDGESLNKSYSPNLGGNEWIGLANGCGVGLRWGRQEKSDCQTDFQNLGVKKGLSRGWSEGPQSHAENYCLSTSRSSVCIGGDAVVPGIRPIFRRYDGYIRDKVFQRHDNDQTVTSLCFIMKGMDQCSSVAFV